MKSRATAHYGASGVASAFRAEGTQNEIAAWAERFVAQGCVVNVLPPAGKRDFWVADAHLSGKRAAELHARYNQNCAY